MCVNSRHINQINIQYWFPILRVSVLDMLASAKFFFPKMIVEMATIVFESNWVTKWGIFSDFSILRKFIIPWKH